MPLTLEIVSEHRDIVGDDAIREFREGGGTIGRSLHNDWILPDPDKYISGKHAAIDWRGGIFYLTDLSSNGVYINRENEPVGRGNTRRLFDGDTLHFGDFKITATIDGELDTLEVPSDPDERLHHDNMSRLATTVSPIEEPELLAEDEITGDDDFRQALFGTGKRRAPKPKQTKDPNDPSIIDVGVPQETPEGVFCAFLEGLGIDRSDLLSDIDLKETMRQAGEVLREYVKASEALLNSRANLKSALNLNQTTVLPGNNNPLKLSENTDDSIKQILVGKDGGEYLGPKDAVKEIGMDLLLHQDAFIEAMSVAFQDYAERFDPEELIQSFDDAMGKKPKLKLLGEQKYWQLYTELYPILVETGGGRFPHMLSDSFIRAYERAVADSHRGNVDRTQRWEPVNDSSGSHDIVDPEISAEVEALPDPEEKSA